MAHVPTYSHLTTAAVPEPSWDEAWFGLLSWKGYLQAFPGFMAMRVSARALDNGDVRVHVATVWEHPEFLEEWRNSDWSARYLLEAIHPPAYDIAEETLEDFA